MNEITRRKLNSTEAIIQAMPRLIEAFVMFYGEAERDNITRKFNKMIVIGYMNPSEIWHVINNDLMTKSNELIQEFLNNLKVAPEKQDEFKKNVFNGYMLDYYNLHPIKDYILYLAGNQNCKNGAVKFVQNFIAEINEENIDEYIQNGKLDVLNNVTKEYESIIKQYEQYKKVFVTYQEYLKKCDRVKEELEQKYQRIMIDKISHLFTNKEIEEIETQLNSPYGRIRNANKKAENYFGYSFNGVALIDAFGLENESFLNSGSEWRKKSIIDDRIRFFKNLGINLGDDYQRYIDSDDLKVVFKKLQEEAEIIINVRKQLYEQMMSEYYQMLDDYQKHVKRIQEAGIENEYITFGPAEYMMGRTYVADKIKKNGTGYESAPLLCFSIGGLKEYLDHNLIHELNHIYELSLQRVEGNKTYSICGWDEVEGLIKNETSEMTVDDDDEQREYELFNEIINEMISQEITKILFDADGYVFNTKENAKLVGGTGYEHARFLVKVFYETYKQEIIESRKNGNMNIIFEVVGKDNFEALNMLFHEFNEHFSGFAFYNLMENLKNKEDNDKTRKFYEIIEKRDKVLLAMAEHKAMKSGRNL